MRVSQARRRFARNDTWTILPIVIVLIAFALRVWDIGGLRMWGDEGFSVYSANRDLYAITFEGKDVDPHPPLYYYLLHFYFPIGGYSEFSIRFLSVLLGTATVALIYAIGKRMFGKRVGALAATMLTLSPFAVHYSQEVRMYALVMFLGALAKWFFLAISNYKLQITNHHAHLHRAQVQVSRITWLGFFLSMLLAQYSLYQAAFVFVAQGIFLAPFLKRRFGFVMRWLAVSLAIVILFIPWLMAHSGSALTDVQGVAGDTTPMSVFEFLSRGFAAISVGTSIPLSNAFTLAALFLAVIVIGLAIALFTRNASINDWLLVTFVALPMISYYPVYYLAPLYRGRLFALALVPLMLLLARSTLLIVERARVMAIPLAILIVGVSAYSLGDYYFRYDRYSAVVEDYLPAIRDIEQHAQPGDVVLFHAYWQEGYFLSHYHGVPLTYGLVDKQPDLDNAMSKPRNVWAIIQALSHHGAEDWFAQNAAFLGEKNYGRMRVLSYRAGTPAVGETFATPITFDNGMSLHGYHVNSDTPLESGRGSVILQLDWQATQNITRDYIVSARVTNDAGTIVWAQNDNPPTNGSMPTSKWQVGQWIKDYQTIPIPSGTPPDAYRVRIVVYEPGSRRVANIVAPQDRRGQSIATGNISVSRAVETTMPITPTVPLTAKWNEIMLVGSDATPEEIIAGDTLPLTLYWQAHQKPMRDYFVHARVFDSTGTLRASDTHRPASPNFPTSAWSNGKTWVDKFNLTIDAGSAPGPAPVFIFLGDEKSNERGIQIGTIKINAREHRFALPTPKQSIKATFGGKIKLIGADLDSIKSGAPISLTLYWQALESTNERYAVFIHVLDSSGKLVAQRDSEPVGGTAPTTSWLANEVIADPYQIDLPRAVAPGDYRLIVGMYSPTQGKRLVVDETKLDAVPLADFKIVAP
ncbi:MAG: glycosyltransferase family 39 protein [Chloroflexi bacterium]|nr:glycosyltransferase family 39 protein [Chloroflexota bacterium]